MMKLFSVLVFCIIVFTGCDRDGYKSYTAVDDLGNIKGEVDPTDWTADDKWTNGIEDLIASECELEGVGAPSAVQVYPAYPNPTTAASNFLVSVEDTCLLRVVIVDKYNTVYSKFCRHLSAGVNPFGLDMSAMAVAVGGRYRLYYDLVDATNTVFYKGHGDIVLQ